MTISTTTKKYICALGVASSLVLQLPVAAMANSVGAVQARCAEDSLDIEQAKGRAAWFKKCIRENYAQTGSRRFHGANIRTIDYLLYDFEEDLEGNPMRDDQGKIIKTAKARPKYLTFSTQDLSRVWKAPTQESGSCRVEPGYGPHVTCTASCYTPEQKILFSEGEMEIKEAYMADTDKFGNPLGQLDVMVVDSKSQLRSGGVALQAAEVVGYIRDLNPAEQVILTFTTESNPRTLRVTTAHPLVDAEGFIREAKDFKVGDSLVLADGRADRIVSIDSKTIKTRTYNLTPVVTGDMKNQVIVAQGFLSGSDYIQNDGYSVVNQQIFRDMIPDDLVDAL